MFHNATLSLQTSKPSKHTTYISLFPQKNTMDIIISIAVVIIFSFKFLFRRIFFTSLKEKRNNLPINWPVIGMVPALVMNVHRIHDYITEVVEDSNGTIVFKGPWFTNLHYVITCDPINVNYILSKNFKNFPKGPDFKKFFEDLGEGIFNAEIDAWHRQRSTALPLLKNDRFENFVAKITWKKSEACLIPILNDVSQSEGMETDMEDLFNRFTFDCTSMLALGHDPCCLGADSSFSPEIKAFEDCLKAILQRHVLPSTLWKVMKWLQVGMEKKLRQSRIILDRYIYDCISMKRREMMNMDGNDDSSDLLTTYLRKFSEESDLFFRDTMFNFMFAGKDTISSSLSWFFYLVAKYPEEQNKIRKTVQPNSTDGKWEFSKMEELKELLYLHAAICETLRLFPSIPLNQKAPVNPDMLPSGHQITGNMKTILPFYSMGRMESIWGKDCHEFKPSRWIAENGKGIISVPSYKFVAFNAGAKSCIGKDMSFIQLKIVTAAVLSRFHFELVDGHLVAPAMSVILHMTNGLKVKVSKIV